MDDIRDPRRIGPIVKSLDGKVKLRMTPGLPCHSETISFSDRQVEKSLAGAILRIVPPSLGVSDASTLGNADVN